MRLDDCLMGYLMLLETHLLIATHFNYFTHSVLPEQLTLGFPGLKTPLAVTHFHFSHLIAIDEFRQSPSSVQMTIA